MGFDGNNGYSAPLKKWLNLAREFNNAFNFDEKYGYGGNLDLPFGRKCFFTNGNYNSRDIPKSLDPNYFSIGSTMYSLGNKFSTGGTGVSYWLNNSAPKLDTLPLGCDPVICLTVKRVGDVYDSTYNYSDLERIVYNSNDKYCYLMGINFYHDWVNDTAKFENVHDIANIADYYILTNIDVYATTNGKLPRTKTTYIPSFVYNYNGLVTAFNLQTGKTGQTPADALFFLDTSDLAFNHNQTNISNAITSFRFVSPPQTDNAFSAPHFSPQNCFNIFAGLKIANVLKITDVNAVMSGGFRAIVPSAYNSKIVFIHKYVENQDVPNSFLLSGERKGIYYRINADDDNHVILSAQGLRNINSIIAWRSLDDLRECFEDFTGRPVVFDASTAINFPASDIPMDIVPSGFDTNSTPSIQSNPDNNTDDFNTPTILNPATIACDNYILNRIETEQIFNWFTQPTFIDVISKLFNDPLSAIIALRSYPFDIIQHDSEHVLQQQSITIVNVKNENIPNYIFDIGYKSLIAGGSIDYSAYYGNWADWALTKYSIYIPYLGIVDISPSAVVNKHLELTYNVDFITGNAAIILKSYDAKYNKSDIFDNGQIVYIGAARIAVDIPIVYNNYNQQLVYSALAAIRTISGTTSGAIQGATQGAASGGMYGAIAGGVMGGLGSMGKNALNFVSDFPRTEYGAKGNIGDCGNMAAQNAYLLIHRRILSIPANGFENIAGAPSSYYGLISSGSGFVKITMAKLTDITATNAELSEIATILENGIYI